MLLAKVALIGLVRAVPKYLCGLLRIGNGAAMALAK
jgi:hypothetical protein